jgi:hypothetical protein
VECYADSDYAAEPDKRRSFGGHVFLMAGGAITWGSKMLLSVATSTMDAEYMAHSNGVKQARWLRADDGTLRRGWLGAAVL